MRDELWRIKDEGWGWGCKGDLLPDWLTDGQTDKQTLVIVELLLLLKRLKNWKQLWKDYTILIMTKNNELFTKSSSYFIDFLKNIHQCTKHPHDHGPCAWLYGPTHRLGYLALTHFLWSLCPLLMGIWTTIINSNLAWNG